MTLAAPPVEAQRERAVRPIPVYVGQVNVTVAYVLSDEILAEARLQEQELLQAGLRLVGNRLEAAPVPASGFRIRVGNQEAMVRSDGTFMLWQLPSDVTQGEVVGKGGALRTTFSVADHIVRLGGNPTPIVVNLELSDRPDLMNEWDQRAGTSQVHPLDHVHEAATPSALCPSADPTSCTQDTTCPTRPSMCCLDYNGLCADGKRYQGSCKLRFLQFTGSTCSFWTAHRLCCFNEAAIRNVAGDRGPNCYTNHKWRICQSLEVELQGLRFSTGPIVPPPPAIETVNVNCGQSVTVNLYNNTCDDETEVTLNGTIARFLNGITCTAGGTVDRLGKLPHYNSAAQTHLTLLNLKYTAPARLPDCLTTPTDVVTAEAAGGVRTILFKVSCAPPLQPAAAVIFSPPPGTYPTPIIVVMTSPTLGVTIYYTTDGSEPTQASRPIANGGTISVAQSLALRARAFRDGFTPSAITTGVYTILIEKVAAPVFTPPAGTYGAPVSVQIISPTPGATVHYTTDGSTPTEASPSALPLQISTTTTVSARAFLTGKQPSDTVTATYTIPQPSFFVAVSVRGDGTGTVTSDPAGINCATGNMGTCLASFTSDALVVLTARATGPAGTSTFAGWGGDCRDAGTNSTCGFRMTGTKIVSAFFIIQQPTRDVLVVTPSSAFLVVTGLCRQQTPTSHIARFQTFSITSTGRPLAWSARLGTFFSPPFFFIASSGPPTTPSSVTVTAQITIGAFPRITWFDCGTATVNLVITAPGASNSPVTVPITVRVTP